MNNMKKVKWYYAFNPCDIDRKKFLAPLGDTLATVWDTFTAFTDCACCLGTRLVVWTALCVYVGTLL